MSKVKEYIQANWDRTVRFEPQDHDTLIGLPKPYIVPTCEGMFQEMYYWDTYFACKGLILSGRIDLAKNCAENMAYLIGRYGFMPNGSRTTYVERDSQPPFFCMIVNDVFENTGDEAWLAEMYFFIRKEYNFWRWNRMTPIGLNRYGSFPHSEEDGKNMAEYIFERTKTRVDVSEYDSYADIGLNMWAEAESGWDFNPRWEMHAMDYAPADLNSNLYQYEILMAKFADRIGNGEGQLWRERSEQRRKLMNQYLWNGTCFTDYNYVKKEFSKIFSAASFYPLCAGLATEEQAASTREQLSKLEFAYGVTPCENAETKMVYQWAYPNLWAPIQFMVAEGLKKYGYHSDAVRLAGKYCAAIEETFERTGKLWEKYNALTGDIDVVNEYEMPEMLGWTAGVYLHFKNCMNSLP